MDFLQLVRHLSLLSAGLVIMGLDVFFGVPTKIAIGALLGWATFKVYYFVRFSFKQVEDVEQKGWFLTFLRMMGMVISLILVSFAVDYATLYQLRPDSFSGIETSNPLWLVFWQFIYFSVATFATVGFGDISPQSRAAEYLVVLEILLSFVAIIFVLSNPRDIKKSYDILNENEADREKQEAWEEKKQQKEKDQESP